MDADFIKKNLFWLLLGGGAFLTVLALILVLTAVGGAAGSKEKEITDKIKGLNVSEVKSEKWGEEASKKYKIYKEKEKEVWKKAEEAQASLRVWPEAFEEKYKFQSGRHAVKIEPISAPETPVGEASTGTDGTEMANGGASDPTIEGVEEQVNKTMTGQLDSQPDEKEIVINVKKKVNGKEETVRVPFLLTYETREETQKPGSQSYYSKGKWVKITYREGRYFGEKLTRDQFKYYTKNYSDQLVDLIKQVSPVDKKGEGIVMLNGWDYEFPPKQSGKYLVFFDGRWDDEKKDYYKEAWIAQEDLWIQRELYRLVKMANDYVAVFKGKGGKEQDKDYKFENPYWRMELRVSNGRLIGNVENLLPRRQRLDVTFWIRVKKDDKDEDSLQKQFLEGAIDKEDYYVPIKVAGNPLDPGKAQPIDHPLPRDIGSEWDSWLKKSGNKKEMEGSVSFGLFGVSQELTWETAAIKRIDEISIGSGIRPSKTLNENPGFGGPNFGGGRGLQTTGGPALSHRMFNQVLKEFPFSKGETVADPYAAEAPPGVVSELGGEQKETGSKLTSNGFALKRYLVAEGEARRVPVAISLVVDQAHASRVQAAFANSKLRLLITQVLLNRYPYTLAPGADPKGKTPSGYSPFGYPYPSEYFEEVEGGPGSTSSGGGSAQSANLELVIFGVASIYNRYPPLPKDNAAPVQ